MINQIIITEDGSHSLIHGQLHEQYHSTHGAISESMHIYIHQGLEKYLNQYKPTEISIFEMGFGTGLNAFLTTLFLQHQAISCHYDTIEKYPLSKNSWTFLNYPSQINNSLSKEIFTLLHTSEWDKATKISQEVMLTKRKGDILSYTLPPNTYDIIYFDAFSPDTQPLLWTVQLFKTLFESLNENGILITYCAKGQIKRNLKAVGFKVIGLPGPKGKREITLATKLAI